jgi:putative N6-adenine-specific DNA methylase
MKGAAFCHGGTVDVLKLDLDEILKKKPAYGQERFIVFDVSSIDDLLKFAYLARSAVSVLVHIEDFAFSSLQDLEKKLRRIPKKAYSGWIGKGSFRITCTRLGEHDFRSKDVEEIFGRVVQDTVQARVSLKEYIVDIAVKIIDGHAVVGIDLAGFPLDKREMHVMRTQEELNGSIAYSALRLSGYRKRGVLLDPFTGSGNLVIEAALYRTNRSVHFYSKDRFISSRLSDFDFSSLDPKTPRPQKSPSIISFDSLLRNIRSAKKNAKLCGVSKQIRFGKSELDWLDTKFSAKEIDFLITAPPFESQLRPKDEVRKLYQELFHQAEYVLKDKGILGLITPKPGVLEESISGFAKKGSFRLWQGKREYTLLVLAKEKIRKKHFG